MRPNFLPWPSFAGFEHCQKPATEWRTVAERCLLKKGWERASSQHFGTMLASHLSTLFNEEQPVTDSCRAIKYHIHRPVPVCAVVKSCIKSWSLCLHTVDGRNPAPVGSRIWFISFSSASHYLQCFIVKYVTNWCRISSIHSISTPYTHIARSSMH